MLAIDADSHFVEPLDLFETAIDASFRDRAYKVEKDPTTGKRQLVVDNKPLRLLDAEELLSAISGYGQKESGHDLSNFDRDLPYSVEWQDMDQARQISRPGRFRRTSYLSHSRPAVGGHSRGSRARRRALPHIQHMGARNLLFTQGPTDSRRAYFLARPGLGGARVESSRKAWMPRGFCRGGALRRQKPRRSDLRSAMGRGAGPRPRGWVAPGWPCPLPRERILPRPRSRFHVGHDECDPGPPNSARHDGL